MILWKNIWYNLVVQQWCTLKYYWRGQHKDSYYPFVNWGSFYYPRLLPWTTTQQDKLYADLDAATKKLKFRKPLIKILKNCSE